MVNNSPVRILVSGTCQIVNRPSGRMDIQNGPVYCLQTAKAYLKEHGLFVINESAQEDQLEFSPELTDDELSAFIFTLESKDWIKSERCRTSIGRTLDCDAYVMKWNRRTHCRWELGAKIYVKFGFAENNPKVLMVSIHPSKYY